ncbi:MAG: phosphate uptake regulator PhoU [Candidatus Nezhaarchaeales archaeon]
METRRVQLVGRATYTVSLPKAWARRAGLRPSSLVYMLEQSDGSLAVYPSKPPAIKKEAVVTTSPSEKAGLLFRKIVAAYLDGCDVIKVRSANRLTYEQLKEIDNFVKRMSGLEIVEEAADGATINALVGVADFPIEQGFRRAHLITTLMFQEAMDALKRGDVELARSVVLRDGDVDRIYFLVARQLRAAISNPSVARSLNIDSLDAVDYLVAVKRIEDTADSVENIAKMVESLHQGRIGLPERLLSDLMAIGEASFSAYDKGVRSFQSKDSSLANEALEARALVERMRCQVEGTLAEQSQLVVLHVGVILINLRNIAYYGGDIAEVAINRAVRSGPAPLGNA